jgi:pteridine reductase
LAFIKTLPRPCTEVTVILGRHTLLITGGAKRLGRAIALEAARRGWDVVILFHRSTDAARKTAHEIAALGGRALALPLDLRLPDAMPRIARELKRRGIRLDLLVHNAAVFERTPLGRATPEHWDRVLDTNLKGPFFLTQALLPLLNAGGSIVHVADVGGVVPWPGYAAYAASKAGLIMLTKVLARALAPRVRVNAVAPGLILPPPGVSRTAWRRAVDKTALRRPGSPADVARAVFFLAENPFTTGQTLLVDGGRHLIY